MQQYLFMNLMGLKNNFFTLLAFFAFILSVNAQNQQKIDSLLKKNFGELFNLTANAQDSTEIDFYAKVLVKKGRLMDKYSDLAKCIGYDFLAKNRLLHEESLIYADSIILTMGENVMQDFPTVAYQLKGDYYYNQKAYQKALENFLMVVSKAKEENSSVMIFRGKLNIADLKWRIGKTEEALKLNTENLAYIQTTTDSITLTERLLTIAYISKIYNEQQKTGSADFYNQYGIIEAKKLNSKFHTIEFSLNQGVTEYHKKRFQIAIDSFEKHIPNFKSDEYSSRLIPERLSLSYFYAGKSYLELGNQKKAIKSFEAIDSLFKIEKNLFPLVREGYEYLIKYYKSKNDKENQLTYINQLIKVDSILYVDKLFLNKGIVMEYDVPKLKFEMGLIVDELTKEKRSSKYTKIILSIFIILLIIALIIQYRKRQRYKKRFQNIINNGISSQSKKNNTVNKADSKTINLQENVIKDILEGLESFEKNEGYLSKKITLGTLSKKLGTNPNYLSKVINHYKKSSFTKYLNTLRVEHSIEQLKTDSTYRKYTIKAIAEEVGFNNVQAFAKAFYHNKGINPSYFLKELKKSLQPSDK